MLIPSPGFETWPEDLMQACREAARKFNLRLIGPGTLGIAVPSSGLNALLSAETPARGDIAFFSRSSAVLERHAVVGEDPQYRVFSPWFLLVPASMSIWAI